METTGALKQLKVLETAEGISGPYCGKLMAGLGADVIKIEPPHGDSARQTGPFPNDIPDPEASGLFLYLNTGKRSVTLDLEHESDTVLKMVQDVDVVIESHPPGKLASLGLGYDDMTRVNQRFWSCP